MSDSRATILNVDDYGPGRYTRSRILRGAGFTVIEAATGTQAVELARSAHPQIALLDVNLPDMSGFEICRAIKGDPVTASTIVIYLSATSVGIESKLEGLDGGGDAYLTEPVEPRELVATVRALLRLKHAEESAREASGMLEAMVRCSPLAVVVLDTTGRVQRWNPAAERTFGWYASEVVSQPNPIVPPDLAAEFDDMLSETLAGSPRVGYDTYGVHRNGVRIPLSVSSAPLRNGRGQLIGVLTILEDVTERKAVEQRMAKLFHEAQRSARDKDEFLALLSHELRTPLNALLGWIRLLRRGDVPTDRTDHALTVIERNAVTQRRLIEDILDVSRIVSGKLTLRTELVDLVALAQSTAQQMQPEMQARELTFTTTLPDTPLVLAGDGARLQQVLLNLLSNAAKFTGAGGRVDLAIRRVDGSVELSVRDTGTGIDPAFLPYVFERFRQADSTRSRVHGGLGLGLAIASHLVGAHGGLITAESPGPGKGARFVVTLPLAAAHVAPQASAPGAAASALAGATVLIVDDDTTSRARLRELLATAGAVVHTSASLSEAVGTLGEVRPDVLLVDMGMESDDAYSLLARLRSLLVGRSLFAIAISAYAGASDRAVAEFAGFDEHLAKPIDDHYLVSAVARAMERLRARRAP